MRMYFILKYVLFWVFYSFLFQSFSAFFLYLPERTLKIGTFHKDMKTLTFRQNNTCVNNTCVNNTCVNNTCVNNTCVNNTCVNNTCVLKIFLVVQQSVGKWDTVCLFFFWFLFTQPAI